MERQAQEFDSLPYTKEHQVRPSFIKIMRTDTHFTDVHLIYDNSEVFKLNTKNYSDEEQKNIIEVKILPSQFISKVKVIKNKAKAIIQIEFVISNARNNLEPKIIEPLKKSEEPEENLVKTEYIAGKQEQLVALHCKFENSLTEFYPYFGQKSNIINEDNQIAKTINTNKQFEQKLQEHKILIFNSLYDYKSLLGLIKQIPPLMMIKKEEYKDVFKELNLFIKSIFGLKRGVTDTFNKINSIFESIISKFKQLSKILEDDLENSTNFKASMYSDDVNRLKKFSKELEDYYDELQKNLKMTKGLRDNDTIQKLKSDLMSSDNVENFEKLLRGDKSVLQKEKLSRDEKRVQFNKVNKLYKELKTRVKDYEIQIKQLEEIISKENQDETNLRQSQSDIKNYTQKFLSQQFQNNDISDLDKLKEEKISILDSLQKQFLEMDSQIKDQIKQETIKIQTYGDPQSKKIHMTIIVDDSTSMNDSWAEVQRILNNFLNSLKQYDLACEISIIFFNSTARIHCRAVNLQNIPPMPSLKGGSTIYESAFKLCEQIISISSSDAQQYIIFCTDGEQSDDIKKSIKILSEAKIKYKTLKFFAVGFGKYYNKKSLDDLSDAANNKEKFLQIGKSQFDFVHEAENEQLLEYVFKQFSNTFDCLAQEKAIEILEKQLQNNQNDYQNQFNFFNNLYEEKIHNHMQDIEKINEVKQKNADEKEKYFGLQIQSKLDQTVEQLNTLNKKKQELVTKRNNTQNEYKAQKAMKDGLKLELETKDSQVKTMFNKQSDLEKERSEKLQQFIEDSGFQSIGAIETFYNSLQSTESVVENLIRAIDFTMLIIDFIKEKIEDFALFFSDRKEKDEKSRVDDGVILKYLKQRFQAHLDSDTYKNGTTKDIILKIIQQTDKRDYQNYQPFIEAILLTIDLKSINDLTEQQTEDLIKKIIYKIMPEDDRDDANGSSGKKKRKDSYESDDDDRYTQASKDEEDHNDKKTSSIDDEELENFVAIFDFGDYRLPNTMKELNRDLKGLKTEMKETQKSESDKIRALRTRLTILEALQNKKTLQKCLYQSFRIINEKVKIGFNKQFKNRIKDKLKVIFHSLKYDVILKLYMFDETVQIYKIEKEAEIDKKLTQNYKDQLELISSNMQKEKVQPNEVKSQDQQQ
ncbi:UNKNOWN [Stylonychia lemnae]|uniref:VWFA domain-containing protein n=1 Tax=Stylonychia lemnae TaxID=5949 RepID=A0A078A450_STYLE|nr:UNKNOWN [Stylonychia lemnae]|eukprot:CDW76659.1 UNKNOWN [Stylonychia lemnae]